jgi:hypothetical protein
LERIKFGNQLFRQSLSDERAKIVFVGFRSRFAEARFKKFKHFFERLFGVVAVEFDSEFRMLLRRQRHYADNAFGVHPKTVAHKENIRSEPRGDFDEHCGGARVQSGAIFYGNGVPYHNE